MRVCVCLCVYLLLLCRQVAATFFGGHLVEHEKRLE